MPLPRADVFLSLSGACSLAGYGAAAVLLKPHGETADVLAFLALFGGLFLLYFLAVARLTSARQGVSKAGQILLWAFLFRLALLPAGLPSFDGDAASWWRNLAADLRSEAVTYQTFLLYDNDVWRYLWDGHVSAHGLDPYAHPPVELEDLAFGGDPRFEPLFEAEIWQDVFDNVSYQEYRTVYPPVAQLFFRTLHALAPASVFTFKAALALVDFATCCLLVLILGRRGRPDRAILYAWNPLALKEIAGSGHVDALTIFFLVLMVWCLETGKRRAAVLAFAVSTLVKLSPILLAGLLLRRVRPRDLALVPVALGVAYLPFLGSLPAIAAGLRAFAEEWVFNPGPWALMHWIATGVLGFTGRGVADAVTTLAILGLVAWVTLRDDGRFESLATGGAIILGGFVVLGPTVMPWYLLWALAFVALRGTVSYAWLGMTCLSLLSYLIYIDQVSHPWWRWTEFLGFFLLLSWEVWKGRKVRELARPPATRGFSA